MLILWQKLTYLTANSNFFIALKAFLASITLLIPGYFLGFSEFAVTAVLGIVAAVISEGDDSIKQRMINSLLALVCFTLSSLLVSLLFPYPLLFLLGSCLFSFAIIILGSLGKRYVTISFATLMIAVYTMLSLSHDAESATTLSSHDFNPSSLLLIAGAGWYFIISTVLLKVTLYNPIRERLADIYFSLGLYQQEKSKFFSQTKYDHKTIRHTLSTLNINIVNAMSECRTNIDYHVGEKDISHELQHLIHLYQEAQELHEKMTSSHFHYGSLKRNLNNDLIIAGFEQVLKQLASACTQRGHATLYKQAYQHDHGLTWSLAILKQELLTLETSLEWQLFGPLKLLFRNLRKADELLINSEPQNDQAFLVMAPREQLPVIQRLGNALHLSSPVFRHAIRLTLGIALGIGIILASDLHGYWVVLTTLFVLQPSYSATRVKLKQRISGTLMGIIIGATLLYLFPTERSQLFLLAISAFLFFYYLRQNYSRAVTYITLLVLLAFNVLYQQGYVVTIPRIIDTLTGCSIAFLLAKLVLPNWQYKQFPKYLVEAITANQNYFHEIIKQYVSGKNNDLPYRVSRRKAYVADSHLIASWKDMQVEPNDKRHKLNHVYDISRRNHAMLSALSALGVHRNKIIDPRLQQDLALVAQLISSALEQTQNTILSPVNVDKAYISEIESLLKRYENDGHKHTLLLIQKLKQIVEITEELQVMADDMNLVAYPLARA
ncbi:YccS family putative transporter [Moritella sp. F3]|uniref:YccS family putative transporter n=1 Tax=Moritella sp. F3 TaxID=2718882 RepID=UPI0018E12A63|nr:YccS family putative transporter [Moritella sp. F3]GIC78924.1 TIGR01666 family membrane protein [Moritella sp. F1]GIC83983.1 TIGR01666 family membrane protein [Moritella sp. F3]